MPFFGTPSGSAGSVDVPIPPKPGIVLLQKIRTITMLKRPRFGEDALRLENLLTLRARKALAEREKIERKLKKIRKDAIKFDPEPEGGHGGGGGAPPGGPGGGAPG